MLRWNFSGRDESFYYLSVQYINVSIAIVLLMQSVWFSVVVESFINKKLPTARKVLATIIVLVGTVLATNLINMDVKLDVRGVFGDLWQLRSYTLTMFTSNTIATYLPAFRKSFIQLLGGAVIVFIFLFFSQIGPLHFDALKGIYTHFSSNMEGIRPFDYSILWTYGLFLAVFGTILPPILFNIGFPEFRIRIGKYRIFSGASCFCYHGFCSVGWRGIAYSMGRYCTYTFAIVLMNLPSRKKNRYWPSSRIKESKL